MAVTGDTDGSAVVAAAQERDARRLERLVQDLMDLARLDADRFSLDVQTIDAATVARQVADGSR